MKTVKRKIRLWLDAYPMRSVTTEDPIVSASQIRDGGWMPDLPQDGLRSIVEVELSIPVLIEETELPAVTAIEVGPANAHALAEERSDDRQQRVVGGKVGG